MSAAQPLPTNSNSSAGNKRCDLISTHGQNKRRRLLDRRLVPERCLVSFRQPGGYFRCLLTSFVIANMFTEALPPKTAFRFSSALIIRLFFLSWSPFFLI